MNKEKFKNNKIIVYIYGAFRRGLTRISPTLTSKLIYRISKGKPLNLKNPKDFDEKLMWLKLKKYYKNPLITECADKYRVREYVKRKGCEYCLNELLGVYDYPEEINWDELPNQFVIKCNHGCGYNIICDDKSKLNIEEAKGKLKRWLKEDFYLENAEVNYKYIKKKIICEKYLKTDDGFVPNDYKIYCFNGEPDVTLVCFDREEALQLVFMDKNWKSTKIGKDSYYSGKEVKKPASYEEMMELSAILSKDFPFVRMDFYDYNGKAILGEMTFTPSGANNDVYTDYGDEYLSNKLNLNI